VRLDVVDSTNRWAADAAREGAPAGLVVVAEQQTAGRGRLGRGWVAPRGAALLCSIVLRPRLAAGDLHLVSTAVALAAADAAEGASGASISLKWPNDLVVGDDKLGGVLAEVVAGADGADPAVLVVGVGLNLEALGVRALLATEPAGGGPAAVTGLAEIAGRAVARDEVLTALLGSLARRFGPDGTPGASTMDEYRGRCSTIGRRVRVDMARGSLTGSVVAIDDAGRLVLEAGGSRLVLDSADVVHLRSGPPGGEEGDRGPSG
jgi:BirA family biotin operon repressor/biotin-[acetyl-CoA-carboxylase] ligase